MNMLLPKLEIVRDRDWLNELHEHACIISGVYGHEHETIDPAHVGTLGKGIKSSDDETLPLLHRYHQIGHQHGEMTMWRTYMPDWLLREALRAYARELYRQYKAQAVPAQRPLRTE